MAALGGGSLASGGGGVALGATALNFVTIGPTLLVGGMVVKGQGTKARSKAREYEARVHVAIASLDETKTRLHGVQARTDELSDLLKRLVAAGVDALDILESEEFVPEQHVDRFQRAIALTMAIRDVAATPVVDGAGGVNDKTEDFAVRYRPMTEENDD